MVIVPSEIRKVEGKEMRRSAVLKEGGEEDREEKRACKKGTCTGLGTGD
jgi:hypothetical protein